MTKKYPEELFVFQDGDAARTGRHLRFMKALFKIDDPEIEQALLAFVERLAAASPASGDSMPTPSKPNARRPRKLPQD
jgi:phytoene dehydrogenase-like protein